MQNYDHIHYLNCPHFTVGRPDQWGEHGYLLYEDNVYFYEEDRKDPSGSTRSPMPIQEFVRYAETSGITVPDDFMTELKRAANL
jgi:hypothetical protein